jgi:hypothetical protein
MTWRKPADVLKGEGARQHGQRSCHGQNDQPAALRHLCPAFLSDEP